ncbi:hypothetical protein O181_039360 [Austropuccinia psidii MF-1]|uniref:Endonuclease/exonuclease/phosphatase domain-containing protein n=1 Tax=Austropuccinia psidii MF-1 TaxID=1389203 RepID=A0A9Q3HF37_9BASI|nr:hypothetical protein [Austropuccinia psidii MF-1]
MPSTEISKSIQLKFLTLNCWGLKFVSSHRLQRIHAIADYLAASSPKDSNDLIRPFSDLNNNQSDLNSNKPIIEPSHSSYDIVALQELWVYHDFLVIRDRAKESGLIYSKWFHSAALGSGLAILSRYPIVSSHFHPYALNGHPHHFIEGDFFVGKSVGTCLLNVPLVGEIEVFTTHLYAPHDVPAPEWKRAHRIAQSWELSKLVRASAERGRTVFVCGDLNSVPSSLPITILQSYGQLRDSWKTSHPTSISSLANDQDSFRNAIAEEGITCDSILNTFTASKNPANRGAKGFGKRLDYIMYRPAAKIARRANQGQSRTEFVDDQTILCDYSSVTLTEPIPVFGYSYSDHFALEASFTIYPSKSSMPDCEDSSNQEPTAPADSLTLDQLNHAISALMIKYRSSERSGRFHLSIFILCVILTPGIAVAASFQPLKFLNWIFTLLSAFVGGLGMTMLYTGFLAGNWERNGIKEICEQMEAELNWLRSTQSPRRRTD